LSTEKLF